MKKIALIAAFLFVAAPAFAQKTAVSATVVDASGIPYANARVSAQLVPSGGATVNGAQIDPSAFSQMNASGVLSMDLWSNTSILPANSQWQITVCETPGVPPPLGTGSQCFTITATITGATQSLTAQMNAAAPALTFLNVLSGSFANLALSNLTAPTAINQQLLGIDGTVAAPAYSFTSSPGSGMYFGATQLSFARAGVNQFSTNGGPGITSAGSVCTTTTTRCFIATTLPNAGLDPGIAITGGAVAFRWPQVAADPSTAGWGAPEEGNVLFNTTTNLAKYWNGAALVTFSAFDPASPGPIGLTTPAAGAFAAYLTGTNCADSAGAAACGSAAAGAVVIDAAATTVVVSTTAVTANSEIFVQYDSSLGTRLGITCNVTVALPSVTARTAATSFTITVPVAPAVNPACYNYYIVN